MSLGLGALGGIASSAQTAPSGASPGDRATQEAAFFNFEDSTALSNFNALIVRANKRLLHGLALQATYAYSHPIDDASSINAGPPVVAQNWQDLRAEEGTPASTYATRSR